MATDPRQARYREQCADDVDEQAQSISAWQQDYLQLSEGPFLGRLDEARHEQLQIFHEYTSQATWQQCQPWHDAIWFGLSSSPMATGLRFNGRQTLAHHLLICPPGQDFTLRTPEDYGIFGLVLDRSYLAQRAARLLGGTQTPLNRGAGVLTLSEQDYWRLSHALRDLLLTLRQDPQRVGLLDVQANGLIHTLLAVLQPRHRQGVATANERRHTRLIARAREMIAQPQDPAVTVDALAARLFMTRRTLQNCVRETLGVTPLTLIHAVRLQALRRDLRNPALAALDIQELAARHDFWHPSHLGKAYKRMFGETLSASRAPRKAVCQEKGK
jgi:AraC family ethanolamine operon transcriptional activator